MLAGREGVFKEGVACWQGGKECLKRAWRVGREGRCV